MKDEMGGEVMEEFVALRPKLYSYRKSDGIEDKKCKGIKKGVVKRTPTFEDYQNCLFKKWHLYKSELMCQSIKHGAHTIEVNILALSLSNALHCWPSCSSLGCKK